MRTTSLANYRSPQALFLLGAFLAVVIGVGALIGINTAPGTWYAELNKPPFNPPNWIFAPVWFTLYVMIAIAGWRTLLAEGNSGRMRLWYGQMLLNWAWSPLFFMAHLVWPAFVVIVAMWLAIAAFISRSRNTDPVSAWLFAPYLAWVSFASLFNLSIGILN